MAFCEWILREGQAETRRRNAPRQMELVHENARSVLRNAPENLFYRAVKTKVYIPRQIGKLLWSKRDYARLYPLHALYTCRGRIQKRDIQMRTR